MAVFFDTGWGDIYAGPTKEACIEAMKRDLGSSLREDEIHEVPGTSKTPATDENGLPTDELITLDDAYDESMGSYCICSENF